MVDAIGVNKVAGADLLRASTTVTASAEPQDTAKAAPAGASTASQSIALSKQLASAAPVDTARVAEIRKAIANGTFPILPATIADRMLALKMDWTTHDKA
ncbi:MULTISPECIES: flagellar biosynthesis anti-sigma factor FlgM [unclassified Sphingomonas]|uniref:flagellar biosynthesis anti-sigma factor FlgM n=1 Tax=unclassified Sphingomonas TaxID=196159 RepID=UPI0022698D0C|nr:MULTISPECIES: flagellar biosynthesis anti-sigma factor FlgM [unclassified Sphingomonas]